MLGERCQRISTTFETQPGRRETDTDPEEPVECRSQMAPAVPAEDELVEVALDVLLAKAVEVEGSQIRLEHVALNPNHILQP